MEPVLRRVARTFRGIELTGPRQSGKTTLLKHVFAETHGYVSLDDLAELDQARHDPRGFFERHPAPLIIDEFQKAPDLASEVKLRIDVSDNAKGLYILTGSENLTVSGTVSESLAGRVAVLQLFQLTERELRGEPDSPLPWEPDRVAESRPARVTEMWEHFLRGYFPEVALDRDVDPSVWFDAYLRTLIERDVRSVRNVGDLHAFERFVILLAARSATVLDLTDIARDLGVSLNTVKAWLSVLEATYTVILLGPYWRSLGKRVVKRPKVYFTDVGLLCHLVGLRSVDHALRGPMAGQIVETAVVADIYKSHAHAGQRPRMYFWRTGQGAEVDIVVETPDGVVPIEVKSAATANRRMTEGIARFRAANTAEPIRTGYVVHPGAVSIPLGNDTISLPYSQL
jgi:predicted AAA+ superfamily ATPase